MTTELSLGCSVTFGGSLSSDGRATEIDASFDYSTLIESFWFSLTTSPLPDLRRGNLQCACVAASTGSSRRSCASPGPPAPTSAVCVRCWKYRQQSAIIRITRPTHPDICSVRALLEVQATAGDHSHHQAHLSRHGMLRRLQGQAGVCGLPYLCQAWCPRVLSMVSPSTRVLSRGTDVCY